MWYYALDGERQGPVAKDKIQDLIDGGDLEMDDLVWTSGMDDWTPISEVDDFQPSPPSLPQEEPSTPTSSRKEDSTGDHQTQAASDSEKSPDEETSSTSMRMWAVVAVVLVLVVLATALIQFELPDGSNTDPLSEEVRFKSGYVNWSLDWASSVDNHKSLNVTVSNFGIVFVGEDKRSLISLGDDDGSEIWRITTEDEISANLSHLHMNVYAVAGKKLLAVNQINGDRRWESRTRSSISTSPVVRNGSVYLGTTEGKIYAFDSESGKKKWEASALEGSVSALSATDRLPDQGGRHILFAGSGKTVVSLDERAEIKWQTKIEVGSVTTLDNTPWSYGETAKALYIGTDRELGGGVVYRISFDRYGPASNRPTVKERLKWKPSESSFPSPTIGTVLYSSDWLYVSTTDGLYVLDVTDGGLNGRPSMEKAWVSGWSGVAPMHQHAPVPQVNTGVVDSDRVIFGTSMGWLRSFISKVEKEFWRLEAKDGWIIPARGPSGLYGVSHGEIYAIEQH